jgi:nitronate monooxygenase
LSVDHYAGTQLLGINHPILLAPMDLVADGRLVAAVDAAGGFGILGGGYGEEKWLVRELDLLDRSKARFGVGFITWSLAKQPRLLDIALERTPAAVMLSFGSAGPFIDRIKRTAAIVICQVQPAAPAKEAAAAGADILVAQGTEAGGHGVTRGLVTLVPEIVDALGGRKPVVARRFYETEALRCGWSVRQLGRQISSQFYERTALRAIRPQC